MEEKASILIVDDDESTRRSLGFILRKQGYETVTAGTGREALEKMKGRFFNAALLDIKLPDMEGIELVLPLKKRHPNMDIIMVTGYPSASNAVRALNEGASAYFPKPLNLDKLSVRLNEIFEKQRLVVEKHQAEKALEENEKRLSAFMNSAPECFILFDSELNFVEINNATLGFPPVETKKEDIIGKNILNIVPNLKETGRFDRYMEVIKTGKPFFIDDLVPHSKFGNRHLALKAFKVGDGLGMIVTDISELKRQAKIKDEFISIVSHELRTPLSIIKEAISLILDRVLGEINEQQEKILTISKNNIDRLSRLINDLLDISKIENGKVMIRKTRVNMTNTIKMIASTFESKTKEKGLELRMSCPEKEVYIYVDEDKIIQLLTILVDNALKFTSQGFIEVSLEKKENGVGCTVEDTGIGILKEDLPKVFDKFTQVGCNNGLKERGVGLGLSVAKGIVELHKGKIWVESKVGKGTKFSFSLPILSLEEIFKEYLFEAIEEANEKGSYFSVIMISILNYKELMQEFHEKANVASKEIEELIRGSLRSTDIIVSDIGEILLILPGFKRKAAITALRRTMGKLKRYFSIHKDFKGMININTKIISFPDEAREEEDILSKIRKAKNGKEDTDY